MFAANSQILRYIYHEINIKVLRTVLFSWELRLNYDNLIIYINLNIRVNNTRFPWSLWKYTQPQTRNTCMVREHHVAVLPANHVNVLCMGPTTNTQSHAQYTYMIGWEHGHVVLLDHVSISHLKLHQNWHSISWGLKKNTIHPIDKWRGNGTVSMVNHG